MGALPGPVARKVRWLWACQNLYITKKAVRNRRRGAKIGSGKGPPRQFDKEQCRLLSHVKQCCIPVANSPPEETCASRKKKESKGECKKIRRAFSAELCSVQVRIHDNKKEAKRKLAGQRLQRLVTMTTMGTGPRAPPPCLPCPRTPRPAPSRWRWRSARWACWSSR